MSENAATQTAAAVTVDFSITHNVSTSKGWGRYKVTGQDGAVLIQSRTGNEWVSAGHSCDVPGGTPITVTIQLMLRVGKTRRETRYTDDYRLIAAAGETATCGGNLELTITGAKKIS